MGKEAIVNAVNLLSEGTVIIGDIKTKNDIRIDGIIKGKILTSGRLVVGGTAKIEGDIECANIDVTGVVLGNIVASSSVALKAPAKVIGNILSPIVAIEPGVFFNGNCQMPRKEMHEPKELSK